MRKVGFALDEVYLCEVKTEIWRRMVIDDKSLLVFALQICHLSEGKQVLALEVMCTGPSLDRMLDLGCVQVKLCQTFNLDSSRCI